MPSTVSTSGGMLSFPKSGTSGSLRRSEQDDFTDDHEAELLSVSWNQDSTCFAAGTGHGFCVYTCEPFKETFRRNLKNGGFKIVEMLFRYNIFALVGNSSQYPPNKVWIWDDHQNRCHCELAFRSEVRAVKLRRDCIVVVLEHKIYVYNFMDLKVLHQTETVSNPRGLCCISHHSNTTVLACPGLHKGQIMVEDFGRNRTKMIGAHDSHIACMALTLDGSLLATASTKGTLIRIFNTLDGTRLQEVRRGVDRADIYSIAISPNLQWLAVSSDRRTFHVFSLGLLGNGLSSPMLLDQKPTNSTSNSTNPSSSLSFMRGVLPKYFSSEWSFAQFPLPEATKFIAAFGSHNTIVLVGIDASFYRCRFDPVHGGQIVQLECSRFPKTDEPNQDN